MPQSPLMKSPAQVSVAPDQRLVGAQLVVQLIHLLRLAYGPSTVRATSPGSTYAAANTVNETITSVIRLRPSRFRM